MYSVHITKLIIIFITHKGEHGINTNYLDWTNDEDGLYEPYWNTLPDGLALIFVCVLFVDAVVSGICVT